MPAAKTIEGLINETGGCGLFQVIMMIFGNLGETPGAWSIHLMTFGKLNPGLECVVNDLDTAFINSSLSAETKTGYSRNFDFGVTVDRDNTSDVLPVFNISESKTEWSCDIDVKSCPGEWKFKSDISTIVTEWGLICDREWITSFIISLQMIGIGCGAILSGQIASKFGRKKNLFGSAAFGAVVNVLAIFANSWQSYGVARFFIGISIGGMFFHGLVYVSEFVNSKYRAVLGNLPDWNINCALFALTVMFMRNWRHLHIATAVLSVCVCIPAPWLPESIRWYTIRGDTDSAQKVIEKIARINKEKVPDTEVLHVLKMEAEDKKDMYKHSYLDIFRSGLLKTTLVFTFTWFCISLIYYGVSFGISALHGNFYTTFLIMTLVGVPFRITAPFVANIIGRRRGSLLFVGLAALLACGIILVQLFAPKNISEIATTVLAISCSSFVECMWSITSNWMVELYPTSLRAQAFGFASSVSRLGGILAPFFLTKGVLSLFVSFLIICALLFTCFAALFTLPETKKLPLKDITVDI